VTDSPAQQRLNQRRGEIIAQYPAIWARMIAEWRSPAPEDRAWLMYSANYLLRTAGVHWATDPFTLHSRLPEAPTVQAAHDLGGLSFALLTHRHADHLDIPLIHALREAPIQWVVPEALLPDVAEAGLPAAQIMVPQPGKPFTLHGIDILPFDGLHWEHTPRD
jgi:L-ascorbate metabolism protein UlaG (beta-lactamase superfamily)